MSKIKAIRTALASLPQTPYADGLGSNTRIEYNPRTKKYRTQNGNEYSFDAFFKKLCRQTLDDDGSSTDATRDIENTFGLSYWGD